MKHEWPALFCWAALLAALAFLAPGFFAAGNLRDIALASAPVLTIACGMTLVIAAGEIDISVGSQFAVLSVFVGLLARTGLPPWLGLLAVALAGAALGSWNGLLIGFARIPSIVVTLAMMIVLRETLRWTTGGAWVEGLPARFQWFGLGQNAGQALILAGAGGGFLCLAWLSRQLAAVRAIYATGSDAEAARLAGIPVRGVVLGAFAALGVLTAVAATLDSVRFREIQSNAGVGLELKAIAAVVVGGASISGGRASFWGTLLGVGLLGSIGPALTFLGVNAAWEKAIQGAIILASVAGDAIWRKVAAHGSLAYR